MVKNLLILKNITHKFLGIVSFKIYLVETEVPPYTVLICT